MQVGAAPLALALPGELWLVAGVVVWPLAAWTFSAAGARSGRARSRAFGRTALVATVVAGLLLIAAVVSFATNGTEGAFTALAAQLAAGASLLGAVLCGVVAWRSRRGATAPGARGSPSARGASGRSPQGDARRDGGTEA